MKQFCRGVRGVGRAPRLPELIAPSPMTKVKTGGTAPRSGQYRVLETKTEITLSRGERVPPYGRKAQTFVLVDKTKHKK